MSADTCGSYKRGVRCPGVGVTGGCKPPDSGVDRSLKLKIKSFKTTDMVVFPAFLPKVLFLPGES